MRGAPNFQDFPKFKYLKYVLDCDIYGWDIAKIKATFGAYIYVAHILIEIDLMYQLSMILILFCKRQRGVMISKVFIFKL